ncbi:hypothetical protein [Aquabacterium sp. J223]|uniref:hypothetical protein n=1 Tax=Aquabacterium sp. J223 TaxID=2898431 RepID=UPI0021ADEB73|nr:hypothetical protein [Aquabacterium sp. J223]UUX97515.1 hypothetical protein LRS07_09900 [Aquabacterium sp. J223]
MKLLLVKTSSMGDVVHALPVVADLHVARPGVEVHWLVEAPFAPIVRLHPGVARVHPWPGGSGAARCTSAPPGRPWPRCGGTCRPSASTWRSTCRGW